MIETEIIILIFVFLILFLSILNLRILADTKRNSWSKLNVKDEAPEVVADIFNINCQKYYLTTREIEISQMMQTGKPYKIIADELNISIKTVKCHVLNMFQKTNSSNKMELVSRLNQ